MSLIQEVESVLDQFRPVFGRKATFGWFVIVFFALMLRMEMAGVTSIVRCMGLVPGEYLNVLNFFHSSAFSVANLCIKWFAIADSMATPMLIDERPLYLVDGIKIGKAGRKMPGVKLLHQESESNTKPEYIMGHYWGAISKVIQGGKLAYALPLSLQIQDGLKRSPSEIATLVDKMGTLVTETLQHVGLVVGDAYFTTKGFITALRTKEHHYIGRAKSNTVGYEPPPPRQKGQRGRPRKFGNKIKLKQRFKQAELFTETTLDIYNTTQPVRYHVTDLLWQGIDVRFVLSIMDDNKRAILLATDKTLSPEDIILAYSLRQKIEVSFKSMVHTLCGFGYHFWMKTMPKLKSRAGNQFLHRATQEYRAKVLEKIEAYERFVNIAAIALGTLQLLAIKHPKQIWKRFPLWLRTIPEHNIPSENVVRLTIQYQLHKLFIESSHSTLLQKILSKRKTRSGPSHPAQIAV